MASVQVNDDRYCHSSFCSSNGYDKYCKENTIKPAGIEIFVKSYKVYVYTVEYKLYRHKHGDHIAPCKQSIHTYEEQRGAYKQNMGERHFVHFISSIISISG